MTQEDKKLLIIDLSSRLPWGVKFLRESWNYEWDQEMSVIEVLEDIDKDGYINNTKVYTVEDIKLYLRPMPSMTEEEKEELNEVTVINCNEFEGCSTLFDEEGFDWLNAHHFDYRGLIEKGLALEAPEGMYKN